MIKEILLVIKIKQQKDGGKGIPIPENKANRNIQITIEIMSCQVNFWIVKYKLHQIIRLRNNENLLEIYSVQLDNFELRIDKTS